MHTHLHSTLSQWVSRQSFDLDEAARFSSSDFRLGVQWLVENDQPDLAQALAEAGLALHPKSEDILAIAGLLAMTRQDWPLAIELLQDLIQVQQDNIQPTTCQMLARALTCNLDLVQAREVLDQALRIWPFDETLLMEKQAMLAAVNVYEGTDTRN
ncbi:MAG: tetratricopeptide repeat protein [Hylemonella sp.]